MRILIILFILQIYYTTVAGLSPPPTDEWGDYNGLDLIDWINAHPDGDIHTSVRIGRERPGDSTSINGLFVKEPFAIEKGDVIAQIPWDYMIHPEGKYSKHKYFSCRAIYYLAKELKKGEDSSRAPYVRYLLSMPRGTMPGEWSETGKKFLADMLGNGELPPYEEKWRNKFETQWLDECAGTDYDELEKAAYWLAASRDEDTLMVPIYDMANHSNDPDKLNTLSYKPSKAGETFRLVANRNIMPGEQIYNSYNRCNACSNVPEKDCDTYSFSRTPDLFVSFGFVEEYPQSWNLDPAELDSEDSSDDETELQFCLDRDDETGEWDTTWEDGEDEMPSEEDGQWLEKQLKRLQKLHNEKDELKKKLVLEGEMTDWEWESSWNYHDALFGAISAAITAVEEDDDSHDEL